jgi:hypothetical protein
VSVVASLALAPAAPAQQPGAPWPHEVQTIYDGLKQECREMGGRFAPDRARFEFKLCSNVPQSVKDAL